MSKFLKWLRGTPPGRAWYARKALQAAKQSPHANPCTHDRRPPPPAAPPPRRKAAD